MALVGELLSSEAAAEALRLHDANVSALAFSESSHAMRRAAEATKTVPSLSLSAVASREDCQAARFYGADGVCIQTGLSAADWDALAKVARGMRMLPLALVRTEADLEAAMKAGARAVVISAPTAAEVLALSQKAPKSATLVADLAYYEGLLRTRSAADADGLRALVGKVDSAVVPPSVHSDASFADLVQEVDP
ncbi:MAG: hypothetical protein IPK82_17070 [Polyangiaceae bacterium]|nr:hypothetical protein [Polyangiaceae bacterium]